MRPHGSPAQLERRRRKAVTLRERGVGPSQIARQLNTTPQTVCQWLRWYRHGGDDALAAKPASGRPPKLSVRQRRGLVNCLLRNATDFGFATNLWTCPRIAELIQRRYGVSYHVDAIPRLMASLGFSPSEARTPRRRA
jgi:transposase